MNIWITQIRNEIYTELVVKGPLVVLNESRCGTCSFVDERAKDVLVSVGDRERFERRPGFWADGD